MDNFLRNNTIQMAIQAVVTFKTWVYGFAGLGGLIALRALLIARRERARALFGLEREAASDRVGSALFTLLVMLALARAGDGHGHHIPPGAVHARGDAPAH